MDEKYKLQSNYIGPLWETVSLTSILINEFEKLYPNKELATLFPAMRWAYMMSIVTNLAKIFGTSSNDSFRLRNITVYFPELKEKVDTLLKEYEDIIGKVQVNRDKLLVHTDPDFHKLKFSKVHIDYLQGVYKNTDFSLSQSASKDSERYVQADLFEDREEVKLMLNEAENLLKQSLDLIEFPK